MGLHRARSRLEWMAITLLLLVAAAFRFHDLGDVPKGLEHDEVATWHMVDRVLAGEFVLYFEEGYGHEPLFNYLTALPVAILGDNWLGLRFWAPWFGLLAVAATYTLMRRLFGPLVALSAAGFQGTVLWALFFNRLGLRLNQLPFLLCVAVYAFWRAVQAAPRVRSQIAWFALAGALTGLSVYTYMSSRVVPLIFALWSVHLVARDRWWLPASAGPRLGWGALWRKWWPLLAYAIVAVLVAAPLALYLLDRPAATGIPQREAQVDMPLRQLLAGDPGPVLRNAWALIKMWNWDGERYWQLNYSHRPVFVEPISGVLFWAGALLVLWRWREPRMALLAIWIGLGMVPSLLTSEAPSWPRTMLASPAALALPGIAVQAARKRLGSGRAAARRGMVGLLVLSLGVTAVLTWRDFLVIWPQHPRVRYAFQSSLTEALRYLDDAEASTPVVAAGLSPHDVDPWTERCTLQRQDLSLRWIDIRSALVLPQGDAARLVVLDITPLDPDLAAWAELSTARVVAQGEVVARGGTEDTPDAPLTYDPAYRVYQLDMPSLRARIARARRAAYAGADPAAAAPLEAAPELGGVVRLLGYEWLSPSRAGQIAQLVTYWLALDSGPSALVYGEPALRTFLHLLDGAGGVAAGVDVLGAAPDTWRPGDVIVQLHAFDAPATPGAYAVELGWYVPPAGPRLAVGPIDAPGERILLDPVEVLE
ncbi:MAG: glycosyltransferase family 39 protein [Anaerolineae bacterium]|nr:glycosyltransferase family 39 protein [Anaerolineae bacterium]